MDKILDLIGNTPIVKLSKINDTTCNIYAKLDHLNPSGSIKDVMALYMIRRAEQKGLLRPGSKIIEVTTGNTGTSLAMISKIKGYKFIAVMPEFISKQKVGMIKAYGGEVVLTPAKEDVAGAIRKYNELTKKNPNAWLPNQFANRDNIIAHAEITGKEILNQLNGIILYAFVAGVGTGGTLMGTAHTLRKTFPKIKIVAVEPAESAVLSNKKPGRHGIEGIGEGFIPDLIDRKQIDNVISIKTSDAIKMAKRLAKEEGLLVGISSGANVLAALKLAKEMKEGNIVTILPDRGERYLDQLI